MSELSRNGAATPNSATPRTDACVASNKTIGTQHDALEVLCRQLERELSELHEECMSDLRSAEALARSSETGRWIAVADRLPERAGVYLTVIQPMLDKPFVRAQSYTPQEHEAFSGWRYMRVTYWMPLPEAPQ